VASVTPQVVPALCRICEPVDANVEKRQSRADGQPPKEYNLSSFSKGKSGAMILRGGLVGRLR